MLTYLSYWRRLKVFFVVCDSSNCVFIAIHKQIYSSRMQCQLLSREYQLFILVCNLIVPKNKLCHSQIISWHINLCGSTLNLEMPTIMVSIQQELWTGIGPFSNGSNFNLRIEIVVYSSNGSTSFFKYSEFSNFKFSLEPPVLIRNRWTSGFVTVRNH